MSEADIQRVLEFWFSEGDLDAPRIDARMNRWFSSSAELDDAIRAQFQDLIDQASAGDLDHWAGTPRGRLALIILLDQFRRNIYRQSAEAFAMDKKALKLCIDGTIDGTHKQLTPIQQVFFFMPLQHSESLKVQKKSVRIYNALADGVSDTLKETFQTFAQFAELHHDIVEEFRRFPHRNEYLERANTPEEEAYLAAGAETFGQ